MLFSVNSGFAVTTLDNCPGTLNRIVKESGYLLDKHPLGGSIRFITKVNRDGSGVEIYYRDRVQKTDASGCLFDRESNIYKELEKIELRDSDRDKIFRDCKTGLSSDNYQNVTDEQIRANPAMILLRKFNSQTVSPPGPRPGTSVRSE